MSQRLIAILVKQTQQIMQARQPVSDATVAADWTHFRGSESTGVGSGDAVPLPFGPKQHLAWQSICPVAGCQVPCWSEIALS
jgi:hypothetical protein